jgi:hypothetical protein
MLQYEQWQLFIWQEMKGLLYVVNRTGYEGNGFGLFPVKD